MSNVKRTAWENPYCLFTLSNCLKEKHNFLWSLPSICVSDVPKTGKYQFATSLSYSHSHSVNGPLPIVTCGALNDTNDGGASDSITRRQIVGCDSNRDAKGQIRCIATGQLTLLKSKNHANVSNWNHDAEVFKWQFSRKLNEASLILQVHSLNYFFRKRLNVTVLLWNLNLIPILYFLQNINRWHQLISINLIRRKSN